ncbi:MAG: AAA family ATPase [Pseudomonadota bacterium]
MTTLYLCVFCGLPGVGKTTLSRGLARHLGGVHLRIDAIEMGLRASRLGIEDVQDAGYGVAQVLARENLALGRSVVADGVHWMAPLRPAWTGVAVAGSCPLQWIEVTCSDTSLRRKRVEARARTDGRVGWDKIGELRMDPVAPPKIEVDTTTVTETDALSQIIAALRETEAPR